MTLTAALAVAANIGNSNHQLKVWLPGPMIKPVPNKLTQATAARRLEKVSPSTYKDKKLVITGPVCNNIACCV